MLCIIITLFTNYCIFSIKRFVFYLSFILIHVFFRPTFMSVKTAVCISDFHISHGRWLMRSFTKFYNADILVEKLSKHFNFYSLLNT